MISLLKFDYTTLEATDIPESDQFYEERTNEGGWLFYGGSGNNKLILKGVTTEDWNNGVKNKFKNFNEIELDDGVIPINNMV